MRFVNPVFVVWYSLILVFLIGCGGSSGSQSNEDILPIKKGYVYDSP